MGQRELVTPRLQDLPFANSQLYNAGLESTANHWENELGSHLAWFQIT